MSAAAYAGAAMMTARACTVPAGVATVNAPALRRVTTGDDSAIVPGASAPATASTSSPTPPGSDTNAPCGDRAVARPRNARRTLPLTRSASTRRGNSERIDVAGVNAGEQRLGQVVHRFRAEAPPHERRNRLVVGGLDGPARHERFA